MLLIPAGAIAGLVIINATTHTITITPPDASAGAVFVDRWLEAMGGAEADRGWQFLGPELQAEAYDGDETLYRQEVEAVDWSLVRWGGTQGRTDDGFFFGYTDLLSDPRTLPRFMHERGLVGPNCGDRAPMGIFTNMESRWFTQPPLQRVVMTGSGGACVQSFYAIDGPLRPPADLVGVAWATGGNGGIRTEVVDDTGLVREVGPGRDAPRVLGEVTVSDLALGQVGVAWVGADCPNPVRIILRGDASGIDLELIVAEPSDPACAVRSRTYEVMLRVAGEVSASDIHAVRRIAASSKIRVRAAGW